MRPPRLCVSFSLLVASLVDLCGMDVLDRLPGRWVLFDRDFTELYGDWQQWDGMRVSNLGFTHHLRDTPHHQSTLKLSATCGNPDTRIRRK